MLKAKQGRPAPKAGKGGRIGAKKMGNKAGGRAKGGPKTKSKSPSRGKTVPRAGKTKTAPVSRGKKAVGGRGVPRGKAKGGVGTKSKTRGKMVNGKKTPGGKGKSPSRSKVSAGKGKSTKGQGPKSKGNYKGLGKGAKGVDTAGVVAPQQGKKKERVRLIAPPPGAGTVCLVRRGGSEDCGSPPPPQPPSGGISRSNSFDSNASYKSLSTPRGSGGPPAEGQAAQGQPAGAPAAEEAAAQPRRTWLGQRLDQWRNFDQGKKNDLGRALGAAAGVAAAAASGDLSSGWGVITAGSQAATAAGNVKTHQEAGQEKDPKKARFKKAVRKGMIAAGLAAGAISLATATGPALAVIGKSAMLANSVASGGKAVTHAFAQSLEDGALYEVLTALLFVARDWRLGDHVEAIDLLIASDAVREARDETDFAYRYPENELREFEKETAEYWDQVNQRLGYLIGLHEVIANAIDAVETPSDVKAAMEIASMLLGFPFPPAPLRERFIRLSQPGSVTEDNCERTVWLFQCPYWNRMGLDDSTRTGIFASIFGELVTQFKNDPQLGFTYNPPEVWEAQQYCPRYNPVVCLDNVAKENKPVELQRRTFKSHILEYTLRLSVKLGIKFVRVVAFGREAAQVLQDLNKLIPPELRLPRAAEVFHPSHILRNQRIGPVLKAEKKLTDCYESRIIASLVCLMCKALIPGFLDHINQDTEEAQEIKRRLTNFLTPVCADWDQADIPLAKLKIFLLNGDSSQDTEDLTKPILDKNVHDVLNETPIATTVLRPFTDKAPLISSKWIEVCRKKQHCQMAFDIPLELSTPSKECEDGESDWKKIDICEVFDIKGTIETMIDLLALGLHTLNSKILRVDSKLQQGFNHETLALLVNKKYPPDEGKHWVLGTLEYSVFPGKDPYPESVAVLKDKEEKGTQKGVRLQVVAIEVDGTGCVSRWVALCNQTDKETIIAPGSLNEKNSATEAVTYN
ncbi:hypothetical protein HDU96_010124 [Phlyctochytrium bullatum]|nr:hypothetical protein HDU96_010124 [Phlyctochytrium bullatum]